MSREAARDHVRAMVDIGFDLAAIADATGLSKDTVRDVFTGSADSQQSTCQRILDLDLYTPIEGHRVPNVIVQHMLDQMRACGLTLRWIYKTAGVSDNFKGNFAGTRVSWDNYIRIKRVYDAFFESDLIFLKEARNGPAA